MGGRSGQVDWRWHLAALVLCAIFVAVQGANLGYGSSVNKVAYIANYRVVLPKATCG